MRCEFPMLTRCCFCFPLRLGLLVWAYIKTVSSAVLLSLLLFVVINDCTRRRHTHDIASSLLFYIPIWSILSADIIFHIIFIISAHKKEHRKMRLFYRYSIFSLIIYISGLIYSISLFFFDSYFLYAFFFGFSQIGLFLWIILIQMYVIILVRSEVVKLKRNMNFEFVNQPAEPDAAKVDLLNVEEIQHF